MSFTANDVLTLAAPLAAGLAIDATLGLKWVNDAVARLAINRPEAQFNDSGEYRARVVLTAAGDTIAQDDRFITALAQYVAAQRFFQEGESANHRTQALELLKLSGLGVV